MSNTIYFYSAREFYGFMSNFAPYPFEVDGIRWPTSEHYFQAMKFNNPQIQARIRRMPLPKKAANEGRDRKKPLRKDWESVKDGIMFDAV